MCCNISKCQKMVNDVAETIVIDYAEQLRESGMSKEQIRDEVVKFLSSENFINAVKRKVDEIIAKFDDSTVSLNCYH